MNRSAYLTTGLAIKALSSLSKADIVVHGKENIPDAPTIFVMNHFTRVETFLLPYYIYSLTNKPVWSLAAASLFKGGLGKFFDLVGVLSTDDPKRDELIVKSLLTGEAHWIIFPEGSMIKTKKIVSRGKYMIAHPSGMHAPHTGAAALALRAELFRMHLKETASNSPAQLEKMLRSLDLDNFDEVNVSPTMVVPVNLTYYPIRTAENIASNIASKLVKDIPDRMVEEIMTEGTMLLTGVDLDIRFDKPINIRDYLKKTWLSECIQEQGITGCSVSEGLRSEMKRVAHDIMQLYMNRIYAMTTINHEHLFASFLRKHPFERIGEKDFKRRVFYAASLVSNKKKGLGECYLHKSLQENQAHLLTDDRFKKFENFFELAREKGVIVKSGDYLVRNRDMLSVALSFHKGRIDNPIEVMANEIEPLTKLQALIRSVAWQPVSLLKLTLIRFLLKSEKDKYRSACRNHIEAVDGTRFTGQPFLLPSYRCNKGVLLIHSYLAEPEEVKSLARYLRRRGIWVYAARLPGHGTSAMDLANRKYREWVETVESGYALLNMICNRVYVGGVAVGGNLSLDLAGRVGEVAGVFAVCPPFALRDYSTNFMPTKDVWDRILGSIKRGESKQEFLDFDHGNKHVNYPRNPVEGIAEVGKFLESIEDVYQKITQPALIIQADANPVVDPSGSRKLYERLGSTEKEFCLLSYDRHVLINGERAEKVYRKVYDFLSEY